MKTANLTDKRIAEFKPGDSLYVRKMVGGFSFFLECEFIRIERGSVVAKIVGVEDRLVPFNVGDEVRCRKAACMLWGLRPDEQDERMGQPRCHWYDKETGGWK